MEKENKNTDLFSFIDKNSIKFFLSVSFKNLSIGPLNVLSLVSVKYPIPGIPIDDA